MIDLANISFRLDFQNYALAVAFFLNVILAVVIFVNSRKQKEYLSFSLLAFSVSLWALGMFMYRGVSTTEAAILWTKFYYVFAGIIPASFLYFSLNFPLKHPGLGRITKWLLTGFGFVSIISPFFGDFIVSDVVVQRIGEDKISFGMGLLTWGFYLVTYFLLAFYFLLNRYFSRTIDRVVRIQYNFILIGSGIAVVIGVFTNHILPLFFSNPVYAWIGPTASLIMTFFILIAMFKHNLFNIKLIITELLMFFVWVVLLVNLLMSLPRGTETFLPNLSVLVILIIAGILVIRGVVNDVKRETREKEKEIQHRKEVEKLNQELQITNEKIDKTNRELDKVNTELEVANEKQIKMLHVLNHDVKNYLGDDRGAFASILEEDFGPPPAEMKTFVEEAKKCNETNMQKLVDYLNSSNLKTGEVKYASEPFDLRRTVEKSVESFKRDLEAAGIKLEIKVDNADNYTVKGDEGKFSDHVVGNLLKNLTKYAKGANVFVFLSKRDGKIFLTIKDTGVGITPNDMRKLFTKGGKGEKSTEINKESTGEGLYDAKVDTEVHGGRIWAESDGEGKGSTFFVELPAIKAND